jgi:hypothetical protein
VLGLLNGVIGKVLDVREHLWYHFFGDGIGLLIA